MTLEHAIKKADEKLNLKAGYAANYLNGWWDQLIINGRVEVGYRACCGSTHVTAKIRAEWLKIVKKAKIEGKIIESTPVKHKNAYATTNGGFWNSDIFTLTSS